MKKWFSYMTGIIAIAVGVLVAFPAAESVSAAPAGAATHLKVTVQDCSSGLASYRLTWTPSGKGPQRVDLSATNNGFTSNFSSGNLGAHAGVVDLTSLKPGTIYYVRIVTFSGGNPLASDTLSFTASCQASPTPVFSVPTDLKSTHIGKGTIRFQWKPGEGNKHFCLDTAYKAADLVNLKGSWRNHGCGTTVASVDVSNLRCGAIVYWRVFAWGAGSGHSQPQVAGTQACTIGQPTQLEALQTGSNSVLLSWKPGAENKWFCVDVAKTSVELSSRTGSWRNHGCWMTGSSIQVANLQCGQTYFWNVYAWNDHVNTRSADSSFQIIDCTTSARAPIESVAAVKVGSRYYADIVAALPDACHSEGTANVERSGNTFNVTVTNNVKPGPCAYVYETYKVSLNLGTLEAGKTYKIVVNGDKSETFVAS